MAQEPRVAASSQGLIEAFHGASISICSEFLARHVHVAQSKERGLADRSFSASLQRVLEPAMCPVFVSVVKGVLGARVPVPSRGRNTGAALDFALSSSGLLPRRAREVTKGADRWASHPRRFTDEAR